ncbi:MULTISPECIES: DNA/RNA non-specific endonuclease [Hymenobacter]|uniref:Endonuclease G n=1 Tax=Hymenobacter mucosus TaxID=1411120 RepID=A0A238ZIR8_9BACT|nr:MULTISPECIES: DNA/RNA non-specific endonuclease [Hymenobacter]SNR82603.1 endonuclease G [Hymenobacter mucosus]
MSKNLRSYLRCLFLLSCLAYGPVRASSPATEESAAVTFQESFDTGTKPDYPAASAALATGNWTLTNAALGSSDADHKTGTQSVRLQQNGKLTMEFFLPTGASTITVQHAIYGTDASSSWELWAQSEACNCNKWTKVGNTVFTTSPTLQVVSFTANIPGHVKFEIRKTSGGAARLNIDDFAVTEYGVVQPSVDNDNLALGNPSGATTDLNSYNNYLLTKPQFVIGYNRDQGKPNWVSWHLDITNRGSIDRQDDFRNDTSLPAGWYQVQNTSYSNTGFDRGHNCPSADRTSTLEDNSATFLMTNMMPQTGDNNQGPWAALESYTRTFLPSNEVYVICGSYGVGGGAGGLITSIDQGRVTVPKRTWKVIVILPVGDNDVARISATTRVIAVDMPNTTGIRETNWGTFRTSVDAIEEATGYDLLSKLPLEVQAALESKVDAGPAL